MHIRKLMILIFVLICGVTAVPHTSVPASALPADKTEPVIPFELINRHIFVRINVNNSDPLWFILDKFAIIDLERAKSLGLDLKGQVNVGGAGAGVLKGAYVKNSSFTLAALEGFKQPVTLALPLDILKPNFGHDVDGIIGSDFIKQFVVEVDYSARVITLHDKQRFSYSGPGEIVPTRLDSGGHPIIQGEIMLQGRDAIKGDFVIDLGSGGALALARPFVESQHLPDSNQKTIRAIGAGGTGGAIAGRIGRISALKIGKFTASAAIQGNIGAQIMCKFKILLDYDHNRIILEPNASFKEPMDHASSGLKIIGEGKDYRTFRVREVLENSPGTEAGLQRDDVIIAINERPAAELTLTKLIEQFERAVAYKLTVRRGEQTLQVTITPRKLV